MGARLRRGLLLAHRWLGIAGAVLVVGWFVSGVVMLYVGYPKLTPGERLARLPTLQADGVATTPWQAAAAAGAAEVAAATVRLVVAADRPVYVVERPRAPPTAVLADTGVRAPRFDAAHARRAAGAYSAALGVGLRTGEPETIDEDAWTHSRALDPHRPLFRVVLDDPARTWVYVSSLTGEVVRDATSHERAWNRVGAWLHWLYPLRGGPLDPWWHEIVVGLSLVATLAAASGLVIGVWRWRWGTPWRNGRRTPYPTRTMRWHHRLGLAAGGLTLAWAFSGLMSMNPWKVFDSGAAPLALDRYAGATLDARSADRPVAELVARAREALPDLVEITWRAVDGRVLAIATGASGATRLFDARRCTACEDGAAELDRSVLERAAAVLVPGHAVTEVRWLTAYDAYWVARAPHTMLGHLERRLPVLRLVFDDPHATWVHVDPRTGAVVGRLDRHGRVKRWLFAFLHSWDLPAWLAARPAWDAGMIAGSLAGLALACTAVVIGARRLRRRARPHGTARGGLARRDRQAQA